MNAQYIISMGVVAPRLPGGVAALPPRVRGFRPAQRRHRSPTREIDVRACCRRSDALPRPASAACTPRLSGSRHTVSTPENRLNRNRLLRPHRPPPSRPDGPLTGWVIAGATTVAASSSTCVTAKDWSDRLRSGSRREFATAETLRHEFCVAVHRTRAQSTGGHRQPGVALTRD